MAQVGIETLRSTLGLSCEPQIDVRIYEISLTWISGRPTK